MLLRLHAHGNVVGLAGVARRAVLPLARSHPAATPPPHYDPAATPNSHPTLPPPHFHPRNTSLSPQESAFTMVVRSDDREDDGNPDFGAPDNTRHAPRTTRHVHACATYMRVPCTCVCRLTRRQKVGHVLGLW